MILLSKKTTVTCKFNEIQENETTKTILLRTCTIYKCSQRFLYSQSMDFHLVDPASRIFTN